MAAGESRAQFDQQPIEAAAYVHAAEAALEATGDVRYLADAERAFGWYLGWNDVGMVVADAARGGCHDGLGPDGFNVNQGAESTLAWLAAVERIRVMRGRWSAAGPSSGAAPFRLGGVPAIGQLRRLDADAASTPIGCPGRLPLPGELRRLRPTPLVGVEDVADPLEGGDRARPRRAPRRACDGRG